MRPYSFIIQRIFFYYRSYDYFFIANSTSEWQKKLVNGVIKTELSYYIKRLLKI